MQPTQPTSLGLGRVFPGLGLLRHYRRQWFTGDLLAGITLAAVMIPSVIAYAELMGLPPQHGLYAALVPLLIYPLFGTSRQVIVGPDIAISVLIAATILPLSGGDPARAASVAALLSVITGILLLFGAAARFGAVADFLSKPVLVGYMSGAALILIASQLDKFIGIKIHETEFFPRLLDLAMNLNRVHQPTLLLGLGLLACLFILRLISKKIPAALVVFAVALGGACLIDLNQYGIKSVGHFPKGLPAFALPALSWTDAHSLVPAAIGIALLIYTEAILLARAFAQKNGYDVDSNQELVALGLANLATGFFQGFSVTGSQARTTLNDTTGGKTPFASVVAAVGVALALLFLTPWIARLPQVALAAILVHAGFCLIDARGLKQILRFSKRSAIVASITTLSVLAAGVVPGIIFGVALSLLGLIQRISNPPDAVLTEVPGKGFHDLGITTELRSRPGLVIYRFYAPLLFSNVNHFVQRVKEIIASGKGPVRWLILDAQAITLLDVTAADAMVRLQSELKARGVQLKIVHANRPLRDSLQKSGLATAIGPDAFFDSVHACVGAFENVTSA